MIRDCKHLIKLQRIHMKQMHSKCAKLSFEETVKYKSIKNTNNRMFWIWKNECIIKKNKRESIGLKNFNDPKAFIEYSNGVQDVYKNIEEYNRGKKRKISIVFDDMIADMINNKKLNSIVTELFIRGRNFFITQSYFRVPNDVRLNSTHFFIMKILNKRELQQIALNHSSDIDFKDFIKIYKNVLQNHIQCHTCIT